MRWRDRDPAWIRWRLLATISPEVVALGMIVAMAILLLIVLR